ncbi:hypothetical protein JCM15579A_03590 [Marinifilum fragile]
MGDLIDLPLSSNKFTLYIILIYKLQQLQSTIQAEIYVREIYLGSFKEPYKWNIGIPINL